MISEMREMFAEAVRPIGWDVYTYEPAQLNTTPCFIIGRPSGDFRGGVLMTSRTPVWAIGRRVGDTDASIELDNGLDGLLDLLPHVATITNLTQTLVTFDVLTFPAYRVDCVMGHGLC